MKAAHCIALPVHAVLLGVCVLLVALCGAGTTAYAELAIRDDWAAEGELTVEGDGWKARFARQDGALVFSSQEQSIRIGPFSAGGREADQLVSCEVVETGAAATVRATFAAGRENIACRFRFTDYGTLQIAPEESMAGVCVRSPIAVGVLPGRRLEDALYRPDQFPDTETIHVPAENWFAGLLRGNGGIVACAWADGEQGVSLLLGGDGAERSVEAIRIGLGGKELFLELLTAPGIWHKEKPELDYLEKDTEIDWKRPFPATYKAQLLMKAESTTPRTFTFGNGRRSRWRPEIGSYVWPVWFDGDQAWMHLGKRVPPKGDLVVYPVEGGDNTLMGFVNRTPLAQPIAKRNVGGGLPDGPRGAPNVGYNACWGTHLLRRTIYTLGLQEREKEFLREHVDYLADRVAMVQTRNAGYAAFIEEMRGRVSGWLDKENDTPVRDYLEGMLEHVGRVEEGYRSKMELYGDNTPEAHIAHADRNAERLKELIETPGPEVYSECERLVGDFNRLAWGHNESTNMRFSMLTREWAQAAALDCADVPEAMEYARQIRAAIRQALNDAPDW